MRSFINSSKLGLAATTFTELKIKYRVTTVKFMHVIHTFRLLADSLKSNIAYIFHLPNEIQ